jgi:Gas vesicle protein G
VGLISGLLTLPLAPVRGVVWITERIAEQAERELYGEDTIRAQLYELQTSYEWGEMSEEELEAAEAELLERLRIAVEHRPAGGPA